MWVLGGRFVSMCSYVSRFNVLADCSDVARNLCDSRNGHCFGQNQGGNHDDCQGSNKQIIAPMVADTFPPAHDSPSTE